MLDEGNFAENLRRSATVLKSENASFFTCLYLISSLVFSSIQSLDRFGRRGMRGGGDMRDDSAEILFQSSLQEAIFSSSGMGRDVHSLMSIQHFLCRSLCGALSPVNNKGWYLGWKKINLSPSYSFHKCHSFHICHRSLFLKPQLKLYPQFRNANPEKSTRTFSSPLLFRGRSTQEPASIVQNNNMPLYS